MTGRLVSAFLLAFTIFLPIRTLAATAPVRQDPATLLLILQQTQVKNLSTDAGTQVRVNYQNTRRLCLDLIFHDWLCRSTGLDADINKQGDIIAAITDHTVDTGIDWANSVLRGKASRGAILNLQDEQIKALTTLRDTIRLGINNRERSPMRAVDILNQAVTLCSLRKLDLTGALTLKALGDQYLGMSRYKQAEDCYERARGVFREYRASKDLAHIYDDLGTLYSNLRNNEVAAESFRSSGAEWVKLGRGDIAGREYIQSGVAFAANGREQFAQELMMYGLEKSRQWANAHQSYSQLVKDLRALGDFLFTRGDRYGACDMYEDAVKQAERAKDRELQIRALKEWIDVLDVLSQPDDSESSSKAAVKSDISPQNNAAEAAQKARDKRKALIERAVADGQAALWKTSKKAGVSIAEIERLLPVISQGAWAALDMQNYDQAEVFYRHAASLYLRLGRSRQAVEALEAVASSFERRSNKAKAISVREEEVVVANSVEGKSVVLADAKIRLAAAYARTGNPDSAITIYSDCEVIYRSAGSLGQLASLLQERGKLYLETKKFSRAADDFREAASIYIEDMGEPWQGAQAHWELADALEGANNKQAVREVLTGAIGNMEAWCAEQSVDPDLEPIGSRLMLMFYARTIPLQVHLEGKQKGWEYLKASEKYRWHAAMLSDLREKKEDWLDAVLDEYQRGGQGTPTKQATKAGEIKKVASNWAELIDYALFLRKWYPPNYRLMRVDPLDIAKCAQDIPEGVAVVDYLFTDTASYAFVVTRTKGVVWQLAATKQQIEEAARRFGQIVRESQVDVESGMPLSFDVGKSEETKPLYTTLSSLYSLLVEPIRVEFSGIRSLAFASPVELSSFPFHALAYAETGGVPRFLIEDYAVGYVGSNSLLDLVCGTVRPIDSVNDKLVVFADPAGNLAGASQEAKLIQARYANSESFVREKATKENFRTAAKSCAVLHVAAHHELNPDQSKFSIVLAPGAASDGVVKMEDLYELRNSHISLVVLSVCEALGSANPAVEGESMVAELFSVAGFRSVVGGLWKVSDKASSILMDGFYKSLSTSGVSRAEALRRAQRALIDSGQFKHPYYWAGFALYGNQN